MKVIIIHPFYPPHLGGGEKHVENLAKELSERKINTIIITANIPKSSKITSVSPYLTIYRYDPIGPFKEVDPIFFSYIKDLIKTNADIIHVHGHMFFLSFATAFITKFINKPLILTLHNFGVGSNFLHRMVLWIRFIVESLVIFKLSKKIIVLTKSQKDLLLKYGIQENKIVVIPNAINIEELEQYQEDSNEISKFLKKYNLKDRTTLLFVGRLMYQKGITYLIEAIRELVKDYPKLLLFIVGMGPEYEKLKEMIENFGLGKNVELLGYVSNDLLKFLYKNVSLVVIPSLFEGIPTVLLESMYFNKKIVISDLPELKEIIKNNIDALIIPPKNIGELVKSIKKIIDNEAQDLGKNGKKI
ncbi:MAG: glycosyltransferase family 4 protein, partial [Candidatus Helarchaeota archaeon]